MSSKLEIQAEQQLMTLTKKFIDSKAHFFYAPVSMQQAVTANDHPAKGPVWASRTIFPAPKNEAILTAVMDAIKDLNASGHDDIVTSSLADVKVQWSGFRSGADKNDQEPAISEKQKYEELMKDTQSKVTILYVHGGFYYTGGPASIRLATTTLAKLSQGRCLVLDQRLCPQNPFPAALIDLLIAYLSLLYPPESAFHEAVPPGNIVISGDSSGGNICLAFLLLIQYFQQRKNPLLRFHDRDVLVPYPAGIATFGAHGDATSSLPSFMANAKHDFLVETQPILSGKIAPCPLWPSKPPRASIYAPTTNLITHPLISPVASKSWPSSKPPLLFFAYGQERLLDDGKFIAKQASNAGALVHFHQYNALPHIFGLLFRDLPQTTHLFIGWANFCRACVEDPGSITSSGYYIYEPALPIFKSKFHQGETFTDLEYEKVMKLMDARKKQLKVWNGLNQATPSL